MKVQNWWDLNLQSLDIILTSGNSRMSNGIKKFQEYTGAPEDSRHLTHGAAIDTSLGSPCSGWHAVHESTTVNKWADKRGVQSNPMTTWINHYDGDVWVRKLDFSRTQIFTSMDSDFIEEHKDDNYESGIPGAMELFLCGLRLHRFIKPIFPNYNPSFSSNPHCTELVAERIKHHGMWKPQWYLDCCVNRMPPWMWWSYIDKYLECDISEPILIKKG